jgi:acyl-CoA thioesterase-1
MFFVAVFSFLAAAALDLAGSLDGRFWVRRVAGFLALLAIPLAGLGAPPLPIAFAILALVATLAYAFFGFGARKTLRRLLAAPAVAACLLAMAIELPYHVRRPHTMRPLRLFVIGDSLASGGFGEATTWPAVLGREMRLPVTNLALPSDNAAMALESQIPRLPIAPASMECVIVEIGGNDMLEGTPLNQFARALDGILAKAGAAGRRKLIMLEIPLLPGRWRYGATQRRLAAKHQSVLVPKRILARVLLGAGNTSDGIHLTQRGHDALARDLTAWLNWNSHRNNVVDRSP